MSVEVMVRFRAGREPADEVLRRGYAPLATLRSFRETWLPVAEAGGLHWITWFETGTPVPVADVADVITELDAVIALAPQVLGPDDARFLVGRATGVRDLLSRLDLDAVDSIYIG